tara:strand:- start:98 stop:280 length:183 start_codon:yes stop_codon:yes gene_type:complete
MLPCMALPKLLKPIPKGTDFNKIEEKKLLKVQNKLNNRPRKIIGYKTPNEIMEFELKNVA